MKSSKEEIQEHLKNVHGKRQEKDSQKNRCDEDLWKYPEPEMPINNDPDSKCT